MKAQAIVEGWDIPVEQRMAIIQTLVQIANDPDAKRRDRTSAAKALMGVPRIQLDAAKHQLEVTKFKHGVPSTSNDDSDKPRIELRDRRTLRPGRDTPEGGAGAGDAPA